MVLGDLALERALVGDLLLEVGGAELLLSKSSKPGASAAPPEMPCPASAMRALAESAFWTARAVPLYCSS